MLKLMMLLFLAVVGTTATAQSFTSAVEYNDYIVGLQNEIGYKMIAFNEQVGAESATKASVQPYYDDLLKTTKTVIGKLEKVKPFEKNTTLKNTAMELFKFYETTITRDYKEMLEVLFSDDFNDASLSRLQELLEKITVDEQAIDSKFKEAQEAFAAKYNIDLEENSLQEQIDAE